jgi:hypothetical protein
MALIFKLIFFYYSYFFSFFFLEPLANIPILTAITETNKIEPIANAHDWNLPWYNSVPIVSELEVIEVMMKSSKLKTIETINVNEIEGSI